MRTVSILTITEWATTEMLDVAAIAVREYPDATFPGLGIMPYGVTFRTKTDEAAEDIKSRLYRALSPRSVDVYIRKGI